jgi:hypothetical protein
MIKKTFLLTLLIMLGLSSFSQKKELLEDKDIIIDRAKFELDSAMAAPEGSIFLWTQKNPIKGEYIFDISIWEKGTVSSIYVVGSNNGTIDLQNRLRAYIMNFQFNFKMPKGKSYKFRYAFNFT